MHIDGGSHRAMFKGQDMIRWPIAVVLTSSLLIGCAGSKPRAQVWSHSTLGGQAAERQFVIDRGECDAAAVNAVQVPSMSTGSGSQTSSTQIQMRSSSGQTYSGEMRTQSQSSASGLSPSSPMQGAIAGYQAGAESGRVQQAQQARQNFFASCMYRKGWSMTLR